MRLEVDRIPPGLYGAVQAKAKREGVSLRALTLHLWAAWLEGEVVVLVVPPPKDDDNELQPGGPHQPK